MLVKINLWSKYLQCTIFLQEYFHRHITPSVILFETWYLITYIYIYILCGCMVDTTTTTTIAPAKKKNKEEKN